MDTYSTRRDGGDEYARVKTERPSPRRPRPRRPRRRRRRRHHRHRRRRRRRQNSAFHKRSEPLCGPDGFSGRGFWASGNFGKGEFLIYLPD